MCVNFKRANGGKSALKGCCVCLLLVRMKQSLLVWMVALCFAVLAILFWTSFKEISAVSKEFKVTDDGHDLEIKPRTPAAFSRWSETLDDDLEFEGQNSNSLLDKVAERGQGLLGKVLGLVDKGQDLAVAASSLWFDEEKRREENVSVPAVVVMGGGQTREETVSAELEQLPIPVRVPVAAKMSSGNETFPVVRDVRVQEAWPGVQRGIDIPGLEVFDTVHWLWCSKKSFEFRHYLSVLSAFRVLQPLKLIMHYTDMPEVDAYNTWFNELKDSLPNLELRQLVINVSCESADTLKTALDFLSQSGGVFMGDNAILTRFPKKADQFAYWFAFPDSAPSCASNGIVFARRPLNTHAREACLHSIMSSNKIGCSSIETYNNLTTFAGGQGPECIIIVDRGVVPQDIMHVETPFAEVARWLFYGRRAVVSVEREGDPIPRISHFIRIRTNRQQYNAEFTYSHFLSVLSALHVAGFQRVLVHADEEPTGFWWKELVEKENVTHVPLVKPESVYQHPVKVTAHVSDIIRYLVLYKYGGAYQDWDVYWTQYLPDSYLAHPAIIGFDWNARGWVDNVNNGVMLARARSHWLHHFLYTHRDFRDGNWGYNSLMMSYRTWELYPWTALPDRHLQVLCHFGKCHPTWLPGFIYPDANKEPLSLLIDTFSVHITWPKPHPSLSSPENTRARTDMYAVMGKTILERSGRKRWLDASVNVLNGVNTMT